MLFNILLYYVLKKWAIHIANSCLPYEEFEKAKFMINVRYSSLVHNVHTGVIKFLYLYVLGNLI